MLNSMCEIRSMLSSGAKGEELTDRRSTTKQ